MPPKKGYKQTPEHIANKNAALKERKFSDETRKKMSESAKKRPQRGEEFRRKISEIVKRRPPVSEETKTKMRKAAKGKHCGKRKPLSIETRQKISGEKSPLWKGGISFEPYCVLFNNEFKERARDFFNNKCVECGKTEAENGRKLDVHHVNYHKDACCNENIKPLFVTLCTSCHMKTNFNREYWEEKYTNLINVNYDGKCYLSKVVV